MRNSGGHLGGTVRRLGLVLALGTVLAAAEDLRAAPDEEQPRGLPPGLPPAKPPLRLVPPPLPATEPRPEPAPGTPPKPAAEPTPARGALRRASRVAKPVLVVAVLLAWAWFMLPQALGGRAGWVLVDGTSMLPHYHTGDLVLVERQSSYHVGQVIAYRVPQGDPMAGAQVIHRIVGGDAQHGFVVQGDNRTAPDIWHPQPKDIVGAQLLRIPDALLVLRYLRSPLLLGLLAASFVLALVLGGRQDDEPEPGGA